MQSLHACVCIYRKEWTIIDIEFHSNRIVAIESRLIACEIHTSYRYEMDSIVFDYRATNAGLFFPQPI